MTRRACAAAHSRTLPRRLLTSAVRPCQPAKPYSRASASWASRSDSERSRASFFACLRRESRDGRAGRDFEAVIATSFHQSPVPRRNQAERRCQRTRLRPKQVGVFPCRGWVAPCQRAPGSIRGYRFDVKQCLNVAMAWRIFAAALLVVLTTLVMRSHASSVEPVDGWDPASAARYLDA